MTETICLLAVFVIIEFLVIAFLLCSLSDIEGQRKVHNEMYTEMESRALNAESDLTQERIKRDRTRKAYQNMLSRLLENSIKSTKENKELRSDIEELKERHSRKNQKRVNGKFA